METNNYLLREIEANDIEYIHSGLGDREVTKYYAVHFDTLEETAIQMKWYSDLKKDKKGIWWKISNKENGYFCGAIGFNDWDHQHRKAEIGMWLIKTQWGKGILKEVFPEVCNYGFDILNLNRIEGFVDNVNIKCKTAMQKINFTHEGTMRQCEMENGKFNDIDIFAMLASDRK